MNKEAQNIIFLDIDGVLNNVKHYKKQHKKYGGRFICENMPFNPRSLKNLSKIVKKTNAKVVISSSWRRSNSAMSVLEARLIEYGVKIYSKTEYINGNRGQEIKEWIDKNLEKFSSIKIIIIDDELYDIKNYFDDCAIVKLNAYNGLTYCKTLEAIYKLRKDKN